MSRARALGAAIAHPAACYAARVEMAKTLGAVRPDGDAFLIDLWVEGQRYKLRHVPVVGGGWLRIRDRDTAEAALGMIRAAVANGATPLQAITPYLRQTGDRFTVERRYRAFVEAKAAEAEHGQVSPRRATDLEGHLRRGWLDPIVKRSILELSYADLEELRAALFARGLAPKSAKHVLDDLRTFLRWLERRGELPRVPQFPPVKVPDYLPTIPTEAQQDAMMQAIPWDVRGFFLARGYMGLRDEEAVRANVEHYRAGPDADADELLVQGKGGRLRLLPVDVEVARWVREFRPVSGPREPGDPLFWNPRTEDRWAASPRRRVMLRAMEAAGFSTRPNEALRHCFGTRTAARLLRDGKGQGDAIRLVMAMMGHTSESSSKRYVKLAAETLRPVVDRGSDGN